MKIRNFTLYLFAVPMLLIGMCAVAQPTIPGSAFPTAGTSFTMMLADTTGVLPQAGGAATTWNFASLTANGHMQVDSFLNPSITPYGGLFTTADIALHEVAPTTNYYVYYKKDTIDGFYQRLANVQPDTVIYQNVSNEFPFPLAYNNSYNDIYYARNQSGSGYVVTDGQLNGTVDGYGTLISPAGTFNNVLRLHATRVENDSVPIGGGIQAPVTETVEYYSWYQANAYFPIMQYSITTVTSAVVNRYIKSIGYRQGYAGGYPAGITDLSAANSAVMLWPNPASHTVTLAYNMTERGESVISIYDMAGRMLQSHSNSTNEGVQTYSLDISALPVGIYDVRVVNTGNSVSQKLQVTK
jgi:hypothetical protein